jgi:hypothetical protein
MTREQDIRKEVIFQLYAMRPLLASASLLARQANKAGLDFTPTECGREAAFLVGQGLVEKTDDPVSGEAKYAITSKGIIHYEQNR